MAPGGYKLFKPGRVIAISLGLGPCDRPHAQRREARGAGAAARQRDARRHRPVPGSPGRHLRERTVAPGDPRRQAAARGDADEQSHPPPVSDRHRGTGAGARARDRERARRPAAELDAPQARARAHREPWARYGACGPRVDGRDGRIAVERNLAGDDRGRAGAPQCQRAARDPRRRRAGERPLPARAEKRAGEAGGEPRRRRGRGDPERREGRRRRGLDHRPRVGSERDRGEHGLAAGLGDVAGDVRVVEEEEPARAQVDERAVPGTAKRLAAAQDRVRWRLVPRAGERRCAGDAFGVRARRPAAVAAGVEEVEEPVVRDERRTLRDALLPGAVRADERERGAVDPQAAGAEALGVDRAAGAEGLPQQPARAVAVAHRRRVDRAAGRARGAAAVSPRALGPRGGEDTDARAPAAPARREVGDVAPALEGQLRRPEPADAPGRRTRQQGADLMPRDEVRRAEDREQRRPRAGRRARVERAAGLEDRRIRVVPAYDGVGERRGCQGECGGDERRGAQRAPHRGAAWHTVRTGVAFRSRVPTCNASDGRRARETCMDIAAIPVGHEPALQRLAVLTTLVAIVAAGGALRDEATTDRHSPAVADERAYVRLAGDLRRDRTYGDPGMKHPLHWAPGTPTLFAAAEWLPPPPRPRGPRPPARAPPPARRAAGA